jgi:thioredoxin-related protein
MKKLIGLIFILTFLLSSCSSSDDDDSNINNSGINPPEWIQGTWLLQDSPVSSGFRFTTDDVCIISFSSQACNKQQLETFNNTDIFTNVSEEITNDYYSVEITISSSITSYQFEKISETEIKWLETTSNAIYTKQ